KKLDSPDTPLWTFLQSHYNDMLAVEMQGLGFLATARANQPVEALTIHRISKRIAEAGIERTEGQAISQEIAARHASAFAFEVLAKLGQGTIITDGNSR